MFYKQYHKLRDNITCTLLLCSQSWLVMILNVIHGVFQGVEAIKY